MKTADQFLRIARIAGAHGLNGRLKLVVITDIIERFAPGNILYLKIDNEYRPYLCTEFLEAGRNPLVKLENINDRDTALSLKGSEIYITRSEAEKTRGHLGSDFFYYYDLIGCHVFCEGSIFGSVADIMEAGENSVLVLHNNEGKEFLIPFIHSMVDTKHIFSGRIDISPIEGLFETDE